MKTKEKVRAILLAMRIEYHWWFICLYRKRGNWLIGKGEALNSKCLLRLNRRIDRHGMIARTCEKEYEAKYVRPARST